MSIESPFEGCVDGIEDGWILGWARKTTAASERIEVAVIVDGMTVGEAIANLFRADLAQAGKDDGHHAFEFQLPRPLSVDNEIRVVYRATGSDLWGSPLRARLGPSLRESGTTQLPVLREPFRWTLDGSALCARYHQWQAGARLDLRG